MNLNDFKLANLLPKSEPRDPTIMYLTKNPNPEKQSTSHQNMQ
jgi:hypothetical protein